MILHGDCVAIMAGLEAESVDSIVTDPPYELGFMGRAWDSSGVAFRSETWAAALRLAKPGAHLLAFGGTRTVHRIAAAIEDAGWEIRDLVFWIYAQGFPKSLDVSKAIDKLDAAAARLERARRSQAWIREYLTAQQIDAATGTKMGHHLTTHPTQPFVPTPPILDVLRPLLPPVPEWLEALVADRVVESETFASREVIAERVGTSAPGVSGEIHRGGERTTFAETAPATADAAAWAGWGTALKPACEPVILARKPFRGSVAANVMRHGTGALNVDGCRIGYAGDGDFAETAAKNPGTDALRDGPVYGAARTQQRFTAAGRWPANVVLTDPVFDGNAEGVVGGGASIGVGRRTNASDRSSRAVLGGGTAFSGGRDGDAEDTDAGTYSRFFLIPKASRSDREPVLRGQIAEKLPPGWSSGTESVGTFQSRPTPPRENTHPTVKPVELMRHLVRMVTPPGGLVLDPFLGSGTTGLAAEAEGFRWVGIELDAEHVRIAEARLNGAQKGLGL